MLCRVVIQETQNVIVETGVIPYLPQHLFPCTPCANEHQPFFRFIESPFRTKLKHLPEKGKTPLFFKEEEPDAYSEPADENKGHDPIDDKYRPGKSFKAV